MKILNFSNTYVVVNILRLITFVGWAKLAKFAIFSYKKLFFLTKKVKKVDVNILAGNC
jgi:hypothetical protein